MARFDANRAIANRCCCWMFRTATRRRTCRPCGSAATDCEKSAWSFIRKGNGHGLPETTRSIARFSIDRNVRTSSWSTMTRKSIFRSTTCCAGWIDQAGCDFVASYAGFENPDWMWTAAGKHWFDRVAGCLVSGSVVLSRRLLLKCLERRLAHANALPAEKEARERFLKERWMNCEAFVPSVALSEGYAVADIQQFVPNWSYSFMRDVDVLYWEMPELAAVPCAHPVFLKQDLPQQINRKLRDLPQGDLRAWVITRARELRGSDGELWEAIKTANAELRTPLTVISGYLDTLADGSSVSPGMGRADQGHAHSGAARERDHGALLEFLASSRPTAKRRAIRSMFRGCWSVCVEMLWRRATGRGTCRSMWRRPTACLAWPTRSSPHSPIYYGEVGLKVHARRRHRAHALVDQGWARVFR